MMHDRGSNSGQLRHFNERVVLDVIRRNGRASKAEIARATHLTAPAVAAIVDSLESAGYVQKAGKKFGGKGQPSVMYLISPGGAFSIGIHIGRRALDAVLIDFSGEILAQESHEYDFPEPTNIQMIGNKIIRAYLQGLSGAKERISGLGIAAPYFLGGWGEELEFTAALSAKWRSLDMRSFFSAEQRDLPVFTENDASAATLAELLFGFGLKHRDFIHLSINTLIGGGLVLDGTLQTGPNGNAAAYGPYPVTKSKLSTTTPSPGPFDILLHRASIYVLMRHLRMNGVTINRVRDIQDQDANIQRLVLEWQIDCAEALAQAIIGSIAVVDVDALVIGGILPQRLLEETTTLIEQKFLALIPAGLVAPKIYTSQLGAFAAAYGASLLPMHAQFGPDRGVLTKNALEKKHVMTGAAT